MNDKIKELAEQCDFDDAARFTMRALRRQNLTTMNQGGCSNAIIMQSGRHKSVESNALYQDPTAESLAHRSNVLNYNAARDGVQVDGKQVSVGTGYATSYNRVVEQQAIAPEVNVGQQPKKKKKKKAPTIAAYGTNPFHQQQLALNMQAMYANQQLGGMMGSMGMGGGMMPGMGFNPMAAQMNAFQAQLAPIPMAAQVEALQAQLLVLQQAQAAQEEDDEDSDN